METKNKIIIEMCVAGHMTVIKIPIPQYFFPILNVLVKICAIYKTIR